MVFQIPNILAGVTSSKPKIPPSKIEGKEIPVLTTVEKKYLQMTDGKPSELVRLLIAMGCNIVDSGENKNEKLITNDEGILSKTIMSGIRTYCRKFDESKGLPTQEADAKESITSETKQYVDQDEFITGTSDLKPVSLNDIQKFFGAQSLIRRKEKGGEIIRESRKVKIVKVKERIAEVYRYLAAKIATKKIGPQGATKFEDIKNVFAGKNFTECYEILIQKFNVRSNEVMNDPSITNTVAEVRTLSRRLDQLAGIESLVLIQNETARKTQEALAAIEALPEWEKRKAKRESGLFPAA